MVNKDFCEVCDKEITNSVLFHDIVTLRFLRFDYIKSVDVCGSCFEKFKQFVKKGGMRIKR